MIAANGVSNLYAVAGRGFDIAEVGLYLDPNNTGKAPPFEVVPEQRAYSDSLRYWVKNNGTRGVSSGMNAPRQGNQYLVNMRAGPTYTLQGSATIWDQSVSTAITGIGSGFPNIYYCELDPSVANATALGRANMMPADNTGFIINNARL